MPGEGVIRSKPRPPEESRQQQVTAGVVGVVNPGAHERRSGLTGSVAVVAEIRGVETGDAPGVTLGDEQQVMVKEAIEIPVFAREHRLGVPVRPHAPVSLIGNMDEEKDAQPDQNQIE
jgi:hypothetical protein